MTGLSTSTAHRLLHAMTDNRLLARAPTGGTGPARSWCSSGAAVPCPSTLKGAALPFMTALRDEVDETVGLHELLPSGERVVVDQVE